MFSYCLALLAAAIAVLPLSSQARTFGETWAGVKITHKAQAQKASREASDELDRISAWEKEALARCQEKIFVNQCVSDVKKTSRKEKNAARAVKRSADAFLRSDEAANRRKKEQQAAQAPKLDNQTAPDKASQRAAERENEEAFAQRQAKARARAEKLREDAQKRQAKLLERQAKHARELAERERAQAAAIEKEKDKGLF